MVQRKLDDELASVASKEYDPNNLKIRQAAMMQELNAANRMSSGLISKPSMVVNPEVTTIDAMIAGRN